MIVFSLFIIATLGITIGIMAGILAGVWMASPTNKSKRWKIVLEGDNKILDTGK